MFSGVMSERRCCRYIIPPVSCRRRLNSPSFHQQGQKRSELLGRKMGHCRLFVNRGRLANWSVNLMCLFLENAD